MSDHDDAPIEEKKEPSTDDRQMAMFCHLGGLIGGFVLPLVIWLMKKDQSPYVDYHGKEALNFQITMMIAHLVAMPLACLTFGVSSLLVLTVVIIFSIMGATAANRGERYTYPVTIRFIK